MKIEKNKVVFVSILGGIVLFLITYSMIALGGGDTENVDLKDAQVPKLEQDQKEYDSKLDAINDLKEVRQRNVPSIYDEKLIDSLGYYDPDLEEKEKARIVDSIYDSESIKYSDVRDSETHPTGYTRTIQAAPIQQISYSERQQEQPIDAKEMGLEHQLFFASDPKRNEALVSTSKDSAIHAVVDGDQVVKVNSRLRMRLTEDTHIGSALIPKNTSIYGFITLQPNRALIEIENLDHRPVELKAYDLQDGSEGIYVENSFRAQATTEVLDDIIQDINIPTVPQVGGITKIFQHNNRNVKITILNNYELILK